MLFKVFLSIFYFELRLLVSWLAFACTLFRNESIKNVGFLDDRYFVYGEDSDWCWRARRKGWKIAYLPYISIVHDLGSSTEYKARKSSTWFVNLSDSVRIHGGKLNYLSFLMFGMIGYSLRLILLTINQIIFKHTNYSEQQERSLLLLRTCYKLLFTKQKENQIKKI